MLRTGWHPSGWWDWPMPKRDKKEIEKCGEMSKMLMQLVRYEIVVLAI